MSFSQISYMNAKTELGYDIIPLDLVGRHAYTLGAVYQDDYLVKLNEIYPLDEVLGPRKESLSEANWKDINHFCKDALECIEGERELGAILYCSANEGSWQPHIIDPGLMKLIGSSKTYLELVEQISPDHQQIEPDEWMVYGVSVARREGFVITTSCNDNVIILPAQKFIEYCISRNESEFQ